ncbi:MAG: type II secretion system F family protein [Peptostreptococcaceae bacterium]|nr:type II secretion system F family protein [Peptostreptococcaceae bacterium]
MKNFRKRSEHFSFQKQGKTKRSKTDEKKQEFYYMLRFYLQSGMPILDAIDLVEEDTAIGCGQRLVHGIRNGKRLLDTLQEEGLTDPFIDSCLQIGENIGDYPSSFRAIVEYLDQKVADRKYFIRISAYPLLLLGLIFALIIFMIFVVSPQLYKTISGMPSSMPWSLEAMHRLYLFFIRNQRMFLFVIISGSCLLLAGSLDRKMLLFLQNFLYRQKPVRRFYQVIVLRRIFWQLEVLSSFGSNLVPALEIISQSTDHFGYRDVLEQIRQELLQGRAFYQTLQDRELFFSNAIISYVKIGENTDSLHENLKNIVRLMDIRSKDMAEDLKKILQPSLIVVAGLMISGLLALVLPIIYATTSIRSF